MKKKKFVLLTVLALVLIMVPTALAAEVVDSGTCGKNISWVLTDNGTLSVSGNGIVAPSYGEDWRSYNSQITRIIINEGITEYSADSFQLNHLERISIPSTLTKIGYNAFNSGEKLKEISTHPDNQYFYYDGHGLLFNHKQSEIIYVAAAYEGDCYFPATLISTDNINYLSFSTTITGIHVDPNNTVFTSDSNGILYDKDQTTVYFCPRSFQGSCQLPSSVKEIDDHAFANCTQLTSVEFASTDGITIGISAFDGCTALETVSIPTHAQLSTRAFAECTNLNSVYFDGVVDFICSSFYGCSNLEYVIFDESLVNINSSWDLTFAACPKLKTLIIPNAVHIGFYTFAGSSIENIYFIGNAPTIDAWAFGRARGETDNRINVNVYYPKNNDSWNDVIHAEYEGFVTWIPYDSVTELPSYPNPSNPFTDISSNAWYTESVLWAVENEITNGVSSTKFAPDDPCKRSQVVTFLHRAMGKPVPSSVQSGFSDVPVGMFYTDAVAWAVENEITNGMGDGTFGTERTCTRAQVVTFLWRAAGCPEPTTNACPFTDVLSDVWYTDAVLWAVENGITNGLDTDTFGVDSTCTRAQIVTFLHRFAG